MNVVERDGHCVDRPGAIALAGTAVALVLGVAADRADAQTYGPYGRRESQEIRQSTEEILSSPEFRHFPRLGREGEGGSFPFNRPGSNGGAPGGTSGESSRGSGPGGNGASSRNTGSEDDGAEDATTEESMRAPPSSPLSGVFSGAVGALYQLIAWTVVAGVVVFILYLIFIAVRNYESPAKLDGSSDNDHTQGEAEPERPPGELPSDAYLKRARELAGEGRYLEAVAQLLLGAMSRIERAGLIRYRRGLTHRDYVRAARENSAMHAALREMVRVYEPLGFGRRTASQEHFQAMLSRYETAFHEPHPTAEN